MSKSLTQILSWIKTRYHLSLVEMSEFSIRHSKSVAILLKKKNKKTNQQTDLLLIGYKKKCYARFLWNLVITMQDTLFLSSALYFFDSEIC